MQSRLREIYEKEIVPELVKEFGYTNALAVPKLTKIVLNMGVGEAVSDKKKLDLLKMYSDKDVKEMLAYIAQNSKREIDEVL